MISEQSVTKKLDQYTDCSVAFNNILNFLLDLNQKLCFFLILVIGCGIIDMF